MRRLPLRLLVGPRGRHGQLAAGFIIIMGLILVMVSMTVNLGQMAQVRTEVSNASDAAALAGASWMASGQNEAALIVNKMIRTHEMVQAIYIVPFCQGIIPQAYASYLWTQAGLINGYLWDSGNMILRASWNIGRREAFTAMVNNLLMRNPQTTGAVFDPLLGIIPADDSVLKNIMERQDAMLKGGPEDYEFTWNNYGADPSASSNPLNHTVDYDLDYPNAPVQLAPMAMETGQFRQYTDAVGPSPEFDCSFDGRGIMFGPVPSFDPNAPSLSPAGGVDISGGPYPVKRWNFPLDDYIPNLDTMFVMDCAPHCGLHRQTTTFPAQVVPPTGFTGPSSGFINSHVEHTVTTPGPVASLFPFPVWEPKFEPVDASTTAGYSAASLSPPDQNARAQILTAN